MAVDRNGFIIIEGRRDSATQRISPRKLPPPLAESPSVLRPAEILQLHAPSVDSSTFPWVKGKDIRATFKLGAAKADDKERVRVVFKPEGEKGLLVIIGLI